MRLYDPQQGQVKIDGMDIRKYKLASLRNQMAVVLQDSYIFNMTIKENIALARPGASDEEVVAAARAAGADEFIRSLPGGYDTHLGEGGAGLSGGQKRRLAIARAILRDAPLVILDEPTVGLDVASEEKVIEALKPLTHGKTTFIVTHQLATIMDADVIVVLSGGRIQELGSHQELLARGGYYKTLWETQQKEQQV
jgi:ATP-binding cassette subfamily B protein